MTTGTGTSIDIWEWGILLPAGVLVAAMLSNVGRRLSMYTTAQA
jgi:hypothetical protein